MDKAYFGEMTLRALTPEYLDWYAKLVEVPSSLTDKIRLILYRAYTDVLHSGYVEILELFYHAHRLNVLFYCRTMRLASTKKLPRRR